MKSNNLAKMIGKRVVQSCITILLVTLFVFALIQMVPGDPVANYLGATATEEQITYYRHLYGFDRPVIVQYLSWIGGLFRGTMGQSISYQSEIADIILPRLGTTLTMVIPAFIIGTITGIPVSYTHLDVYKRQVWCCAAAQATYMWGATVQLPSSSSRN